MTPLGPAVLALLLAAAAGAAAAVPFERTLEHKGIRFHVSSANDAAVNTLRIVPSGLAESNAPIERTVDGTVTGADVADLDADGSPEIYVYATSAGSGSYGTLVAYAASKRRALALIHLAPVTANKAAASGYMGHDTFAISRNALVQRFPVYRDGDANAKPSGGTRELHYRLVADGAAWRLRLERIVER